MSSVGWYPDPGGKPGRYRYWDGESWSAALTDDPADPPPGAGTARRPARDADQHRAGRSFAVAVVVLILVVISAVLIVRRTADAGSALGSVPPTSTATPWDDAGSVNRSGSTTSSDRSSPAATASAAVSCPVGGPDELSLHPQDGRIHGGRLSMAPVPGYSDPEPEYMLSWMWDTQGVDQVTEPGWQSIFAVGEIHRTEDFNSLRSAARSSLSCALRNGWYLHLKSSKTIRDESITIDGHRGWIVAAEVRDASEGISVAGDQLTFVVVDDGRSDAFSVWCGMVPLGDQHRLALDQQVLSGLKVRG